MWREHTRKSSLLNTSRHHIYQSCFTVVIACFVYLLSSNAGAQDSSTKLATEKVWTAASELESGNYLIAEQLLDEAAESEGLDPDIRELIAQLRARLPNQQESSENVAQLEDDSTRRDNEFGMTSEELEKYLEEISNAVEALFRE